MSILGTILGDPGADSGGGKGKTKRAEKNGTKKSKERGEEPLGTMSYQNSSKRQRPFWLLIGDRKLLCFYAQSKSGRPWSHFVSSYTHSTWSSAVRHVYLGCSRRCICDYLADKYAGPFAGIITVAYLKLCENIHRFTDVSLFCMGCMDIS